MSPIRNALDSGLVKLKCPIALYWAKTGPDLGRPEQQQGLLLPLQMLGCSVMVRHRYAYIAQQNGLRLSGRC